MTDTNEPDTPIPYREAVDELETILDELERDDVDVDALAAKVERAAVLLAVCRDRIGAARVQVERVVAELSDLNPTVTSGGDDGAAGDPDGPDDDPG